MKKSTATTTPSLRLPTEVLLLVLDHLSLRDISVFAVASHRFRNIASSYLASSSRLTSYPWLKVPPKSTLLSLVSYVSEPDLPRDRRTTRPAEEAARRLLHSMETGSQSVEWQGEQITRENGCEVHSFQGQEFRLPLLVDGFLHIYWPGHTCQTKSGSWVVQIHVKKVQWGDDPIPASSLNLSTANRKVIRGESLLIHTQTGIQFKCSTIFCYETLMQSSSEDEMVIFFVTDLDGPEDRLNEIFYGDFRTGKITKLCETESHAIHCSSRRGGRRFLLRNRHIWMLACDPNGELRVSQLDMFQKEAWIFTEGKVCRMQPNVSHE